MQNPLWFSWKELSLAGRFFLLVLASGSTYLLFSALIVLRRVHSIRNRSQRKDALAHRRLMQALQARCSNMDQLIAFMFYLFGFVFFLMLPSATRILGSGRTPVSWLILQNFLEDFAYAANVFLVFLILSSVRWFACTRVQACMLCSNTDSSIKGSSGVIVESVDPS